MKQVVAIFVGDLAGEVKVFVEFSEDVVGRHAATFKHVFFFQEPLDFVDRFFAQIADLIPDPLPGFVVFYQDGNSVAAFPEAVFGLHVPPLFFGTSCGCSLGDIGGAHCGPILEGLVVELAKGGASRTAVFEIAVGWGLEEHRDVG